LLDNFDDRYLGAKTSDPALDNDGNALVLGALYFNSTDGVMKVYTASGWIAASSASVATLATFEFVATAGQTVFTGNDANGSSLSYVAPAIIVTLNGVRLRPGDDYTATNGTSLTLVSAAALNDELVVDAFGSFLVANTYTIAQTDAGFVAKTSATGAANLPSGTTGERPGAPAIGMFRMNSTTNNPEWYDSVDSVWREFNSFTNPVSATGGTISDVRINGIMYRVHTFTSGANFVVTRGGSVEYLIAAGGGGGGGGATNGNDGGGGGGAGGLLAGSLTASAGTYSIVIGGGGAGGGNDTNGSTGSNTTALGFTANGGGYGGGPNTTGGNGGCGGGSGGGGAASVSLGGTGSQGRNGGSRLNASAFPYNGGGGGGIFANGLDGVTLSNANGGSGFPSQISGSQTFYCGGGGGGAGINTTGSYGQGYGGLGGGGNGGQATLGNAAAGTANTGGGGGGGNHVSTRTGGNGGSGVVIIRYRI
jgi:hypothetical protein